MQEFEFSSFVNLLQLFNQPISHIRAVTVEQRPISKVLLDGLYDAECPLSQLRGCQHVMKMIWEEV